MPRHAWKVSDLLLLVLSAGLAFGAYRHFFAAGAAPNERLYLTAYLALLTTATLGVFLGRPALRRPCQGYAAFGWCTLIFVLRGGFGFNTFEDAVRIVEGSQMGMAFGAVCALVAAWFLEPPRGAEAPAGQASGSNEHRRDGEATDT